MTRGLFRLWLVASLIWVVMLLPGLWGGTKSPFPAFTLADNIWFETTHHTFDNASYVYTPDGKTKPEGTKAKKVARERLMTSPGGMSSMIMR
jgi:hypothetical protein